MLGKVGVSCDSRRPLALRQSPSGDAGGEGRARRALSPQVLLEYALLGGDRVRGIEAKAVRAEVITFPEPCVSSGVLSEAMSTAGDIAAFIAAGASTAALVTSIYIARTQSKAQIKLEYTKWARDHLGTSIEEAAKRLDEVGLLRTITDQSIEERVRWVRQHSASFEPIVGELLRLARKGSPRFSIRCENVAIMIDSLIKTSNKLPFDPEQVAFAITLAATADIYFADAVRAEFGIVSP